MSTNQLHQVNSAQKTRRFPGKVVAVTLMTSIIVVAIVAQIIHVQNLRARQGSTPEAAEPTVQEPSRQ